VSGSIELPGHRDEITALAFSPDGRWLAAGSLDRTSRLWDLHSANPPAAVGTVLEGHAGAITSLAFSPDGRWLVTGSQDGTARLWDLQSDEPERAAIVLSGHSSWVSALAFSPDGRWLATGTGDQTARMWDLQSADPNTNNQVLPVPGNPYEALTPQKVLTVMAFSPDGRWLATGSADRSVRLWDLDAPDPAANWQLLGEMEGTVTTLAFSPDGHWLATGSSDSTARLWPVRQLDLIASACASAGRNFSLQEWVLYFPNQSYRITCEQWPEGR
jgi:WD40 repeat protein